MSGTIFQAELSTVSPVGIATQTIQTAGFTADFSDSPPNTTYYARVKALGVTGEDSAYLFIGLAIETTLSARLQTRLFIDVELSSITASWTAVPQSGVQYVAELAASNPFAVPMTSTTFGTTAEFDSLSVNTLYYFRVRAQDPVSLIFSVYSSVISTYTLANPPVSLDDDDRHDQQRGLGVGRRRQPGRHALLGGALDRRHYVYEPDHAGGHHLPGPHGFRAGTSYMYRVLALNGNNVPSAPSNTVLVTTTGNPIAPKRPSGLWIERVSAGGVNFNMTYHWHLVSERTDGSALANLAGYQIYQSPSLLLPRAQWTLLTTVPTESWSTTANTNAVNYYSIRAIDTNGLQSDWTEVMDDTVDMNHFFLGG